MTPLTRLGRIEALRMCEDRIRAIRQGLEEEERGEAMAKALKWRKANVG